MVGVPTLSDVDGGAWYIGMLRVLLMVLLLSALEVRLRSTNGVCAVCRRWCMAQNGVGILGQ